MMAGTVCEFRPFEIHLLYPSFAFVLSPQKLLNCNGHGGTEDTEEPLGKFSVFKFFPMTGVKSDN